MHSRRTGAGSAPQAPCTSSCSPCAARTGRQGTRWAGPILALLGVFGGCDRSTEAATSPRLVAVDSVTLSETDSSFVAQPTDLAVTSAGGVVISDGFLRKLLVFGPDGRFQSEIGRRGDGPGEFQFPSWVALAGDSIVYAANNAQVQAYDLRTGAFLGQNRFELPPRMMQVSGRGLYVGYADSLRQGSIALLDPVSGNFRVTGPFPAILNHPMARAMFANVVLAVRGDSIASAYTVSDKVFISRRDGTVVDSIPVPVARRNGANLKAIANYLEAPTQENGELALYGSSVPMDIHWLSSGNLALVSMDWRAVNGRVTGTYYLSILDPETRKGCVDTPIPGPVDPAPSMSFRGDTLFALTQRVSGSSQAIATIHKYRIDTTSCKWVAA